MLSLNELKENKEYVLELKKLKEGEKISLISDIMFEVMMNNENRIEYSSYLISKILKLDYEEVRKNIKLKKSQLEKREVKEKGRRVDYVANIGKKVINIEMNNNSSVTTMIRNIKYVTELYQGGVRRSEEYDKEEKVIQINLNNFSYGEEKIEIERFNLRSDRREVTLINNLEIINIYLPEIRKKYYNKEEISELEKMILVMIESSIEEVKEIGKEDVMMDRYIEESIEASSDEDIVGVYDKELDDQKIREGEKKEYYQQGIDQRNIEIAKTMLEKNMDLELIVELTGLTKEKIEELK